MTKPKQSRTAGLCEDTSPCLLARTSDQELALLLQRVRAVVLVLGSALVEPTLLLGDVGKEQGQGDGIFVHFPEHRKAGSWL